MIMIDSGKSRADLWQFAANVALEVFNKIYKSSDDDQFDFIMTIIENVS